MYLLPCHSVDEHPNWVPVLAVVRDAVIHKGMQMSLCCPDFGSFAVSCLSSCLQVLADFQGGCWVHGLVAGVSVVTQIPVHLQQALRREEMLARVIHALPYSVGPREATWTSPGASLKCRVSGLTEILQRLVHSRGTLR